MYSMSMHKNSQILCKTSLDSCTWSQISSPVISVDLLLLCLKCLLVYIYILIVNLMARPQKLLLTGLFMESFLYMVSTVVLRGFLARGTRGEIGAPFLEFFPEKFQNGRPKQKKKSSVTMYMELYIHNS